MHLTLAVVTLLSFVKERYGTDNQTKEVVWNEAWYVPVCSRHNMIATTTIVLLLEIYW
jgi:hypothetical protein